MIRFAFRFAFVFRGRSRLIAACVRRTGLGLVSLLMGLGSAGVAGCADGRRAEGAAGAAQQAADPARGQRLLAQYQCGSCHAIPGVPASRGLQGPSLDAFGKRSYIAGRIPNVPETLAQWLVAPATFVPDTAMPSMGVSPADAQHMAAYLGQLE